MLYIKSGVAPFFNTEWPAVYIRETAKGRHTIRVVGQRRLKTVKWFSLVRPIHSFADQTAPEHE